MKKMKKAAALMMTVAMMLSMAACGKLFKIGIYRRRGSNFKNL